MADASFAARLQNRFPGLTEDAAARCVIVPAEGLKPVCIFLKENGFDYLMNLAALDTGDKFAVVYHLCSFGTREKICLKVFLEKQGPRAASVADIWRAADWHEREAFDLMGIFFEAHPDLRRILLPDEWSGHPLRKDFSRPGFVKMSQV